MVVKLPDDDDDEMDSDEEVRWREPSKEDGSDTREGGRDEAR